MGDERRTLIAIFISIVIVMMYSELILAPYTRPYVVPPETPTTGTATAGANTATNTTPSTVAPAAATTGNAAGDNLAAVRQEHPNTAQLNLEPPLFIDTPKARIKLSRLGGRILSLRLKGYKRERGSRDNYEMAQIAEGTVLPLAVYVQGLSDDFVHYKLTESSLGNLEKSGKYEITSGQELHLKLTGTLDNNVAIEKIFKFSADSYLFDLQVNLSQPTSDGSRAWLEWAHFDPNAIKADNFNFTGFVYVDAETTVRIPGSEVSTDLRQVGESKWISFADKYFMATLIPSEMGQNTAIKRDGDVYLSRVAGTQSSGSFRLYVGPKDYTLLKSLDLGLERNIDLGWFTFLAYPLLMLLKLFYSFFGNYGISIVLLTIVIKAAFLPLTKSSFKSMAAMQKIQPEMQALRQRLKGDPNKLNQEMLALYKRHGVNPMGGCFPILIQIPVFLGLYNALLYAIELRHAPFAGWIQDLSAPEELAIFGVHVPVMVILMGVMMLWQQWITPTPDPTQKKVMMVMTVLLSFLFVGFPAGLVLYWLTNNIISVTQQSFIRNERKLTPGSATAAISIILFALSYLLTVL